MDNKCIKEGFARLAIALAVVVFGLASLALGAEYPLVAPINPEFTAWQSKAATFNLELRDAEGHTLGLVPSPIDRSHLLTQTRTPVVQLEGAPPSSYDLRNYGWVTPVKNQLNCGTCWAFASYGSLESWLLQNAAETWDFSENRLKNYHGFDYAPCAGGTADMSTAYLARWSGPVSEADDPYNPWDDRPSPGGPPQKYLKSALWFFTNTDIQNALMTYGGMYVPMYWGSAYYNPSTYTYYYSGSNSANHAVTLIGWDDNKVVTGAPGNGAWLAKNSWGTGWGNSGFFWISYYDTVAVMYAVAFCDAVPTSSYATNYQYDPLGITAAVGYGSTTAWAANIFIPTANEQLKAVGLYAIANNVSYEIYVYDTFSGGTFSNLLGSISGTLTNAGYHTITLASPISLTTGDNFAIVVKFTTPGYNYPVPIETDIAGYSSGATAGSGQSYVSPDGSMFTDITTISGFEKTNVCIRGLTLPASFYVDANATGANDGTSWTDAYTDLQSALSAASSGYEIWVAAGTYLPTTGTDRTMSFVMRPGVAIYGGFAGTETLREQRDWVTNQTILSGNIGTPGANWDNSYHVVTGSGTNSSAILDGFTITVGNADGSQPYERGGGMCNSNGSPTVTNCTFSGNSAYYYGGGMCNYNSSSPTVTNCTFSNNWWVYYGGGMYNEDSSPTVTNCTFNGNRNNGGSGTGGGGGMGNYYSNPKVTNCTFSGNEAYWSDGGGMDNLYSNPTVTNCTFAGNWAYYNGGGMNNYNYSSPTVTNCTFSSNSAMCGGGMLNLNESSPTVTNCTFSGNSGTGGGMYSQGDGSSSPTVTNCILWGNTAPQIYNRYSYPTITYSDVQGGYSGAGNIDANPLFIRNPSPGDYGNLRLWARSPCIDVGSNNAVPADITDLDGDGNTTEPIPFDLAGRQRIRDGNCDGQVVVDMGAYEFYLVGDLNNNCNVNFIDYAFFALRWFETDCEASNNWCDGADLTRDGRVNWADLFEFAEWWLVGTGP